MGEQVDFQIEDEQGQRVSFRLDRRCATALVVMGLEELARLPQPEGELLQSSERPLLQGRPSFQVAIDHQTGDALVGFRLHPLSALHFLFEDELASKLVRELSEVLKTPDRRGFNELKANSMQATLKENSHDHRDR